MSIELDKLKMLGYNIIEELGSNICIKQDKIRIIPTIGDHIEISTSGGVQKVFCRKIGNYSSSIITIHPNSLQPKSKIKRGSREYCRRGDVNIYLERCTAFCCRYMCDIGDHTIQINDNVVIDGDICIEIRTLNNINKIIKSAYLKVQVKNGALLIGKNGNIKIEFVANNDGSLSVIRLGSYIICMETGIQIMEENEPFSKNKVFLESTETKELYALDREDNTIINMVTGNMMMYNNYKKGNIDLYSLSNGDKEVLQVRELTPLQKTERLLGYKDMYPTESEFYVI